MNFNKTKFSKITEFTYNTYGIPTTTIDPRGNTTNYELTAFNQIGTGTTSEGITTSYEYDENNNKTKETKYLTGGLTQITTYTYDVLDNITKIVQDYDANKQITSKIVYDNNGNITEKQIGSGAITRYTYNEFGAKVQKSVLI